MHRGMLQLPRAKFEALPALQNPDLPPEWGCRRATALQLAIHQHCVVLVVSEETGRLSLFTSSCVYTEDDLTSDFGETVTFGVERTPESHAGEYEAIVSYDGEERGELGSLEGGYLAVCKGDEVIVLTLRPEPMHEGNRFDHYVYAHAMHDGARRGWIPEAVLQRKVPRSSLKLRLPYVVEFLRRNAAFTDIPEDTWPNVDGWEHPRKMFELRVHFILWKMRESLESHAIMDFYSLWGSIVRALPAHKINEISEDGSTLLSCMLLFAQEHDHGDLMDDKCADIVKEFVRRSDLHPSVTNSIVTLTGQEAPGYAITGRAPALWLCLRGKKVFRNGRSCSTGNSKILQEVALVMLEACELSSEVLDFTTEHGDTLLHYILEPSSRAHECDKSQSEARLCCLVAAKLSLHQLCHRNDEGICALSYSEQYAHNTGPSWHQGAWHRVLWTIGGHMLTRFKESITSSSSLDLGRTVGSLKDALESAATYQYEHLDNTEVLQMVVATMEDELSRHFDITRAQLHTTVDH